MSRSFRELLAVHMEHMGEKGAVYLFESVRKHKYPDRGVRNMFARYAAQAGITRSMSPHKWRHFLFTWLKKEGIFRSCSNTNPVTSSYDAAEEPAVERSCIVARSPQRAAMVFDKQESTASRAE